MKFGIVIKHEQRNIRLVVERVSHNPVMEQFEVTARNTSLRLQTNRLLLRNKGLKHKPAAWKIIGGTVRVSSIKQSIVNAIENKLNELKM